MEENLKKEYLNDDLTVVWQPSLCIHSEICVRSLPSVYQPKSRPWISPKNASKEELIKQIETCPSGALSYYMKTNKSEAENSEAVGPTSIEIIKNGPALIIGDVEIKHSNGNKEFRKGRTTICRCGYSNNKPFCDGSHKLNEYEG